MRRLVLSLIGLVTLAACAGPVPTPTRAITSLRVPVGYIPSVQFAPFYVAIDKGYFAEEGLAVDLDYSFETNGVQLVGANSIPFAVASGEQVLLARAQGLPVTYVFAWFQKFPLAIVSKPGAGITTPADLKGKHIGTPSLQGASYVGLRALLAYAGIQDSEVTITDVGFNQAAALSAGQVEAVVVYSNNEPVRLVAQGEALNTLYVSDYVPLASNGLLTNATVIAQQPDRVRAFVRAFRRGLQDALADPAAAYAICKKYVTNIADDQVELDVLKATLVLWQADRLGYAEAGAWDNMHTLLRDTGLLTAPVEVPKAYTNDFVP